jgi:xanthine dehydrogenase accessory factor
VKEILPEIDRWKEDGEKVVVATVVATRRSAPRPIGASLAISESGKMCGSVSGGCVESDVFENAQEVLATGEPKLVSYGIAVAGETMFPPRAHFFLKARGTSQLPTPLDAHRSGTGR